jgi:hypothetical protein
MEYAGPSRPALAALSLLCCAAVAAAWAFGGASALLIAQWAVQPPVTITALRPRRAPQMRSTLRTRQRPTEPSLRRGWAPLKAESDGTVDGASQLQPEVQAYLSATGGAFLLGGMFAAATPAVLTDLAAGFLASISVTLLGYPLDTAKTRLQVGQPTTPPDGILGLYRGLGVGIAREAVTAAIYIAACGFLKALLVPPGAAATLQTLLTFLFIGAAACLASCTSRVPLEIMTKQIQTGSCTTVGQAARRVFFADGACGVVQRSWVAVVLREVPYGALQIAFFELAKLLFTFLADMHVPILLQRMAWGAVAGSGAALLTTPFDVITSRVMTSAGPKDGEAPTSVWDTVQNMYRTEGLQPFFTGGLLRALFYAPGTCIFFAVYETVAAALK